MKIVLIILCFSVGLLYSCESNQNVSLTVRDAITNQPLDSVLVEFKAGKNDDFTKSGISGFTDSTGTYVGSFMIGCSFGCYDYFFECSKPGYETFVSDLNVDNADVLLVKE